MHNACFKPKLVLWAVTLNIIYKIDIYLAIRVVCKRYNLLKLAPIDFCHNYSKLQFCNQTLISVKKEGSFPNWNKTDSNLYTDYFQLISFYTLIFFKAAPKLNKLFVFHSSLKCGFHIFNQDEQVWRDLFYPENQLRYTLERLAKFKLIVNISSLATKSFNLNSFQYLLIKGIVISKWDLMSISDSGKGII